MNQLTRVRVTLATRRFRRRSIVAVSSAHCQWENYLNWKKILCSSMAEIWFISIFPQGTSSRCKTAERDESRGYRRHAGGTTGTPGASASWRYLRRAGFRRGCDKLRQEGRSQRLQDHGCLEQSNSEKRPVRAFGRERTVGHIRRHVPRYLFARGTDHTTRYIPTYVDEIRSWHSFSPRPPSEAIS